MPTPIEPDTKVNSEWVASANIQTSEKAISETQEPAPAPASNETGPKIGAVWRGLVGIETGIVAGAVMTVYLMLDAALRGSSVWSLANLCASNFYGASALGGSFRGTTMAGLAWMVASSGVLGWITSLALRPFLPRRVRCALVGILMATGWYYGVVRMLWPMWNPLARRQPYPDLLFGHVIFGLAMGGYPRFLAQLRNGTKSGGAANERE